MKQNKLKLEDLKVQSFETKIEKVTGGGGTIKDNPFEPTPGTWCFVCPVTDLPIK